MRDCTAAKIAETFLLLPSPNSLVDGFVSNLTLGYYIWLYGYRYIRACYEPGREKYLCIYNHITKYNSQVFLNTVVTPKSCSHPIEYADEIPDRVVLYNIFPMCALFLQKCFLRLVKCSKSLVAYCSEYGKIMRHTRH